MSSVTFEVTGIKKIQRILNELPEKEGKNLIKATVRGVAAEVNKEIKSRVPKDTGNLKRSFKVKPVRSPPFQPVFDVRAESGKTVKNDGFYWRFVEYGTGGKSPSPERPFVRPARDLVFDHINEILVEQFVKKLAAAAKRKQKRS